MWLAPTFDDLFARLFTSDSERGSLIILHSASKGLLDEIAHARRGLDREELGHVTGELDVIISILESERRLARRFTNGETLRSEFVNAHAAISNPGSSQALRRELDQLSERALEMHRFLERRIPRDEHLPFRPPHHRGAR